MNTLVNKHVVIGHHETQNPFMGAPINIRPYSRLDGSISEKNLKFYEEYGRSKLGLLVTGAGNIKEDSNLYAPSIGCWDDDQIEGLAKLDEKLKACGSLAVLQIAHRGFKHLGIEHLDEVSIEVKIDLQKAFIDAAVRAKKAGFDGIELHACHGFFLNQIISPRTNTAVWQYGGSVQKRANYMLELIAKIRAQCGERFIIGVRMGAADPDLQTSIHLAQMYEKQGADYLSVSASISELEQIGGYDDAFDLGEVVPENFPYCKRIYAAWRIKQNVHIPVACIGEIYSRMQAENILAHEYADFVGIGRARLADPNWLEHVSKDMQPAHCLFCTKCAWFTDPSKCPGRELLGIPVEEI